MHFAALAAKQWRFLKKGSFRKAKDITNMANIMDYLDWRGDLPFSADAFNDIDNQLCAQISFIDFKNLVDEDPMRTIPLDEAVAAFFDKNLGKTLSLGVIVPAVIFDMAKKMSVSPRFGKTELTAYKRVEGTAETGGVNIQWTALTLLFEDKTMYVSFAGTDDTLVSWKEDFDLAVLPTIPSQADATEYLNMLMEAYPEYKVRIGGHSKGGNLAVYAAAMCKKSYRDRILMVYDNDGPGFTKEFLKEEGYRAIRDRIRNIIPEQSVVGLLLEHDTKQIVVKSTNKNIFQHDSFSWEVSQNRFVMAEGLSKDALLTEKALKSWLAEMTIEERRSFVEAIYKILTSTGATTLAEMVGDRRELLHSYRNLDPESRAVIHTMLGKLLGHSKNAFLVGKFQEKEETKKQKVDYVTHLDGASIYGKPKKKKK